MYPDLEQFRTLTQCDALNKLRADGYAVIADGFDSVVLARPGDDFVVKLTLFIHQAQAFARLCRENEGNPHLPKIYATALTSADSPVLITVMERLLTLADIPVAARPVPGGSARALALLLEGHPSHDDVHALMLRDKESPVFRVAVAILSALEDSLRADDDVFLYYDSGFDEDRHQSVETWTPDNILFRRRGSGYQYVFADPLREGRCSDPAIRTALANDFAALAARLHAFAAKEKDPAAGQGLAHKPGPAP